MKNKKVTDSAIAKVDKQKVEIKDEKKTAKKVSKAKVEAKVEDKKPVAKRVNVGKKETKQVDLSTSVFDGKGKVVEEISLPKEIFGVKINNSLMAQAVRVYLANQRLGTASTKTRGEVRGSTRKIYRQKGTGRARHGAITAPIFVGGGIVFGPKPRDFSLKLPKMMRRKALFSALTLKLKDKKIFILDAKEQKGKTKEFMNIIKALNLLNKKGKADKVLFVLPQKTEGFERAARNIEGLEIEKANLLNTYEILNSKNLLILKDSLKILADTFLKS